MKYNLTIQQEDYGFVTEAIKLRTLAILESFEQQVADQSQPIGPCSFASAPVKAEGAPFTFVGETKKKPHWTQTAKGKKIMAARKRKGTK
jgi:hypothetical protein